MKKIRKVLTILMLVLGICILLNGCTEKKRESDAIYDSSTVDVSGDTVGTIPISENVNGILEEATMAENISLEKSPKDMTTAEKLQYLSIEGQQIGLPCKVGDLSGGLALGDGVTIEDERNSGTVTICSFEYDGVEKGSVYVDDCYVGSGLVDMGTGYEDKSISRILSYNLEFEILGVTEKSSMDDIISAWGEPPYKEGGTIEYYDVDVNPEIDQGYDYISFGFDSDGSLMLCLFTTDK